MIKAVRKTQTDEEFPAPFHRRQAGPAGDELRQHNILQSVELGEKMVELVKMKPIPMRRTRVRALSSRAVQFRPAI